MSLEVVLKLLSQKSMSFCCQMHTVKLVHLDSGNFARIEKLNIQLLHLSKRQQSVKILAGIAMNERVGRVLLVQRRSAAG